MGRNKLLLPFGNHTVLEETLSRMTASELDEIIVVTGFQENLIRQRIGNFQDNGLKAVHNPNYCDGRSESIKCAVRNIDNNSDAILFMVADKPTVKADLVKKALAEFRKRSPLVLYIRTPAGRGHPVIFSRKIFDDLLSLKSEPAGDSIFEKYRENTVIIEDNDVQPDIDTPEDYDEVLRTGSG
jgi:molybdenum cofactor cytidylyltransferase